MNVTITTDKSDFIKNNVPRCRKGTQYIGHRTFFPQIRWDCKYYLYDNETNSLFACKILAFAYVSDAKIMALVQSADGLEWRDDVIVDKYYTNNIFNSKEDYFNHIMSENQQENIFGHSAIENVLPEYKYAAVVGFKSDLFVWKNSRVENSDSIEYEYLLVTKAGIYVCVHETDVNGHKVYTSKEKCLMENLSTMVIHDFDEKNGTMTEAPLISKKTFRFRYAMETFIDAENEDKAREIFENSNLDSSEYVEIESVEEW